MSEEIGKIGGISGPLGFPEEKKVPVTEKRIGRAARIIGVRRAGKGTQRTVRKVPKVESPKRAETISEKAIEEVSGKRKAIQKLPPKLPTKKKTPTEESSIGGEWEQEEEILEEDLKEPAPHRVLLISEAEQKEIEISQILSEIKEELLKLEGIGDPIVSLEGIFPKLDKIAEQALQFKSLQEDLRILLNTMKSVPNSPKHLLVPLLRQIYIVDPSQKNITVAEAKKTIADLLFLLDQHPEIAANLQTLEKLDDSIKEILWTTHFSFIEEEPTERYIRWLFPMTMARLLLRPDGTLNLGFVDRIMETLRKQDQAYIREAHSALKQLQADPTLCEKLRNFPTPRPGSVLDKTIHACLRLSYGDPITHLEIEKVCLAALLGWWRQSDIGNCYAVSFTNCIRDATLSWILDDLKEIAEKEVVTRKIGDKLYEFPALFRLKRSRTKEVQSLPSLDEDQEPIGPATQHACSLLGCTTGKESEEFYATAQEVAVGGEYSFYSVFERLAQKNSKDKNTLREALQYLDALGEVPLLDLCENAMASMFFPPLTAQIESTEIRLNFSMWLTNLFFEMTKLAKLSKCEELLQSMHTESTNPLSEKEQEEIDALLKEDLAEENRGDIRANFFYKHRIQKQLSSLPFQCLDRLVVAYAPPYGPKEKSARFILCEKTSEGIKPLSPMRFRAFLIEMFSSIALAVGETITSETEELLQKAPFENSFKEYTSSQHPDIHLIFNTFGCFDEVEFKTAMKDPDFKSEECSFDSFLLGTSKRTEPTPAEVFFGNFSRWGHIDLSKGRTSLMNLLQIAKDLSSEISKDHGISLPSAAPCHRLVFLPTHPTLTRAFKNIDRTLDAYEQQGRAYLQTILDSCPELQGLPLLPQNFEFIVEVLRKKFFSTTPVESPSTSYVGSLITGLMSLPRRVGEYFAPRATDFFDLKLLKILMAKDPSYSETFFHFADLNYERIIGDTTLNLHLCFWYNPLRNKWLLISAPDKKVGTIMLEDQSYLNYEVPGPTHIQSIQQKQLLTLERKTRERLLQIEEAFIKKRKYLEEKLSSLPLEKRQNLVFPSLPELPATLEEALKKAKAISRTEPQSLEEALFQCRELQDLFLFIKRKAIEEIGPKVPAGTLAEQGIEMRTLRFGAYATELRSLDDPYRFQNWVLGWQ